MSQVEFLTSEKNGIIIIRIVGQVDLYNMGEFKAIIVEQTEKSHLDIIINLAGMDYIDSSGISVLITSYTNLKNTGGNLFICEIQPSVYKIFEMTKLTAFFKIFNTEEEALAAIKK